MKRFLIALTTITVIILAFQITAYGGTTTVVKSEWSSSDARDSSDILFDMELIFDCPLKEVRGYILLNNSTTDDITEAESISAVYAPIVFAQTEITEQNNYTQGRNFGAKYTWFKAIAYAVADSDSTTIRMVGDIKRSGADMTGIVIRGIKEDGTVVNIWGRKRGISIVNLRHDKDAGFITIDIVLKIPVEEYDPDRGDAVFRFEILSEDDGFDRVIRLSKDNKPSADGYYYISDHLLYHSPPSLNSKDTNIITVRQKPSALYETEENFFTMDAKRQETATINIEWTERLRKAGKTVYATGEIH